MKFNYENLYRKSPKPLWFRTFLRRYLNRFALLVAEAGLDLHFLPGAENRGSPTSSRRRQRSYALHLDGFESTFFTSIKKEPPGKTGGSSYAGIALCSSRNT